MRRIYAQFLVALIILPFLLLFLFSLYCHLRLVNYQGFSKQIELKEANKIIVYNGFAPRELFRGKSTFGTMSIPYEFSIFMCSCTNYNKSFEKEKDYYYTRDVYESIFGLSKVFEVKIYKIKDNTYRIEEIEMK